MLKMPSPKQKESDMDKMREEFESQMRSMGMFELGGEAMALCVETGGYADQDTNAMWSGFQIGWKASRSALCVKLPCERNVEDGNYKEGVMMSLDNAGVRYE